MAILIYLGDIIYLNILGQPIVILNSKEAIADLLDTRGVIYSDRPTLAVLSNWLAVHVPVFSSRTNWLFYSIKGWLRLGSTDASLRRGDAHSTGLYL